jgi:hypothetical protein
MQAMSIQVQPGVRPAHGVARRTRGSSLALIAAIGVAFSALLLLAMIPRLSQAGGTLAPAAPVPMAAPAPVPATVTGADFPESANPWRGCVAIVAISNATSAPRSEVGGVITGQLMQDACFGA